LRGHVAQEAVVAEHRAVRCPQHAGAEQAVDARAIRAPQPDVVVAQRAFGIQRARQPRALVRVGVEVGEAHAREVFPAEPQEVQPGPVQVQQPAVPAENIRRYARLLEERAELLLALPQCLLRLPARRDIPAHREEA